MFDEVLIPFLLILSRRLSGTRESPHSSVQERVLIHGPAVPAAFLEDWAVLPVVVFQWRCVIGDLGSPHYRNGWLLR